MFVVPARDIDLPRGFSAVSVLGRAVGVLAYVEYRPPSPLSYRELIWMPSMVKAGGRLGYWVAKMYVDDERSLEAGRREWALPKTLAHFDKRGDVVDITADDGTRMMLRRAGFGPRKRLSSKVATLQHRASVGGERGELVRFRCSFSGTMQLGQVTVEAFESDDPGWRSFTTARRLPGSSALMHDYAATMHPPQSLCM